MDFLGGTNIITFQAVSVNSVAPKRVGCRPDDHVRFTRALELHHAVPAEEWVPEHHVASVLSVHSPCANQRIRRAG
eukprot:7384884-Prymnesium_polylepis.2